jgi:hypothetical protein
MTSLKGVVAIMEALLLVVGKALIHPVKRVSMKTRKYLMCLTGVMLVKSTCHLTWASDFLLDGWERRGRMFDRGLALEHLEQEKDFL